MDTVFPAHDCATIVEVPAGTGIAWPAVARGRARLLVVYERTAKHRRRGPAAVLADVYAL
ncbi:MAG: hypothetical protein Q7R45_09390 [Sulfuricaulis sp.]|nr:hypothetical protein [Sulfuricaulis sp.]